MNKDPGKLTEKSQSSVPISAVQQTTPSWVYKTTSIFLWSWIQTEHSDQVFFSLHDI